MFVLRVFGCVAIEGDKGPLHGPATQRHRLALLTLLAAAYPHGVLREKLIGYLWPERDSNRARNLLNQGVYALRRALGEGLIVSSRDELRLDPERLSCDLLAFEAAVSRQDLTRAAELYRGPFLDGFFLPGAPEFERWIETERRRRCATFRRVVEQLARESAAAGNRREAVERWRRLAADDPYNAQVTLHLMEALEANGDRAAAMDLARVHACLFREELKAEPDSAVMALAERMRTTPRIPVAPQAATTPSEPDPHRFPPAGHDPQPQGGYTGLRLRSALLTGAAGAAIVLGAVLLGRLFTGPTPLAGAADTEQNAIAVFPFQNLSARGEDEAFVSGIQSDLTTALSEVPGMTVVSRTATPNQADGPHALEAIARELHVRWVVEGGVQRSGEHVRVNARLTDAGTGHVRWSDAYDGDLTLQTVFAIQARIVGRIAAALRISLTPTQTQDIATPPTSDLTAYQYLQQSGAVLEISRAGNEEAERLLRLALRRDPEYADAWADLAMLYSWRPPYLGVGTWAWDSALAYGHRALRADPRSSHAYAALADVYGHQGALGREERMAREALRLDPNSSLARRRLAESYRERGSFPEALRHHLATVRLAPTTAPYRTWVGYVYADLGDDAAAERWYRGVLTLAPTHIPALDGLAQLYVHRAMRDSALHYVDVLVTSHPRETLALTAAAMACHYLREVNLVERYAGTAVAIAGDAPARTVNTLLATTLLGFARLQAGDREGARTFFQRSLDFLEARIAAGAESPRWTYELALIDAARGYLPAAVDELDRAFALGFRWSGMLELEPMLHALRGTVRFERLLARVRTDVARMRQKVEAEPESWPSP